MGLLPDKAIDRVQFYENHISPFTTNAVAIGITSTEATDLQTKTEAARAAYDAQQAAKDAAKTATEAFQIALDAMNTAGAALIKKIRAKAAQSGPTVYTLAQIPAPATPTPVGAPACRSNRLRRSSRTDRSRCRGSAPIPSAVTT